MTSPVPIRPKCCRYWSRAVLSASQDHRSLFCDAFGQSPSRPHSENIAITLTSSYFWIRSSGGSTMAGGSGAAAGVGVAGPEFGVDTRAGDASPGAVPGFAGSEGCSGVGVLGALGLGGESASCDAEAGMAFAALGSPGAVAPSLSAAAFARAWAMRSACLVSCCRRKLIRASSCLILRTKSLTSPGLQVDKLSVCPVAQRNSGAGTHWKGCCKSVRSR